MYYGHSSWIALVVFGGMFAMRYVSAQRRRGGFRGGRASRSSFTGTQRRGPTGVTTDCDRTGGTASTGMAAGPELTRRQAGTSSATDEGARVRRRVPSRQPGSDSVAYSFATWSDGLP